MPDMPIKNPSARDARNPSPAAMRSRPPNVDPRGAGRTASTRAPRESDIERALVRAVKEAGGYCRKWTSPGCRGVPDRIVVLNARTWFVEVKAPGKQPTAAQAREHDRIAVAGGGVWVVDSVEGVAFLVEQMLR